MSTYEPSHRKSVLLVEDDDVVRFLTVEILEEFGYRVQALGDAVSALELLRSGEPCDLLMSDVGLPGLGGRELVVAARELRPTLPVLFASGYSEQGLLDDVRQKHPLAPTDSIVKPFDLDLLARRLSDLAGA
ncbi:response regulator [Pseudomonas sp. Gutcm_11s]|uniref:response regulator n=1 Tax=Pseudomonas sp. Gutcm_11s TaxID=3026088 RepID=UPI002361C372|nr:response regulator [Pseudomonas sp. Gutcm_11s]MDD0844953.1 response regulator [Pseudomonas sp. Gutcm_11s]